MDGRLGNAAAPLPWIRLVHRSPRCARCGLRGDRRYPPLPRQLSGGLLTRWCGDARQSVAGAADRRRSALGAAAGALAVGGGYREPLSDRLAPALDPRAAEHLPGRRGRTPAPARRGAARLGPPGPAGQRDRPGCGGERGAGDRGERHVLRLAPQPEPPGPRRPACTTAGKPGAAEGRGTTGRWCASGLPRRSGGSRSTPASSRAMPPAAAWCRPPRSSRERRPADAEWETVLPKSPLLADLPQHFDGEQIRRVGSVDHVRLNIFPDGGVARLRLWGAPVGWPAGAES